MPETILVLGADGYTGHPLVCRLLADGRTVIGVDNHFRRDAADSVTPIAMPGEREDAYAERFPGEFTFHRADVRDYQRLRSILRTTRPDTVVNLAQVPSAPFSMESRRHSSFVQDNNVQGSLNVLWAIHDLGLDTHLVQLATMGEYGTPDAPIPEGFLDDGRPAPKEPGSFYHASKCQMTTNTLFASRIWDIPVTEIYQGIVYGLTTRETQRDERLMTRFDAGAEFGTVLNRFTAQAAVGHPLTVYGEGGQTRAMLSLADCVQCLTLAIDNPPIRNWPGRYPYRAINQFDGAYKVRRLAETVAELTGADIEYIDNPRVEQDAGHRYEPERRELEALGYEPTRSIGAEVELTLATIEDHTDRINVGDLRPDVHWR